MYRPQTVGMDMHTVWHRAIGASVSPSPQVWQDLSFGSTLQDSSKVSVTTCGMAPLVTFKVPWCLSRQAAGDQWGVHINWEYFNCPKRVFPLNALDLMHCPLLTSIKCFLLCSSRGHSVVHKSTDPKRSPVTMAEVESLVFAVSSVGKEGNLTGIQKSLQFQLQWPWLGLHL